MEGRKTRHGGMLVLVLVLVELGLPGCQPGKKVNGQTPESSPPPGQARPASQTDQRMSLETHNRRISLGNNIWSWFAFSYLLNSQCQCRKVFWDWGEDNFLFLNWNVKPLNNFGKHLPPHLRLRRHTIPQSHIKGPFYLLVVDPHIFLPVSSLLSPGPASWRGLMMSPVMAGSGQPALAPQSDLDFLSGNTSYPD